tara:strand:+ start:579 stop:794 length:216 start_codon:yes stop_codon:yes gene_type:complete
MKKNPPIPIDPRDRIVDQLIDDKNRLYKEMKNLQRMVQELKAQKRLLRSRIKFLQEKYSVRGKEVHHEKDY